MKFLQSVSPRAYLKVAIVPGSTDTITPRIPITTVTSPNTTPNENNCSHRYTATPATTAFHQLYSRKFNTIEEVVFSFLTCCIELRIRET